MQPRLGVVPRSRDLSLSPRARPIDRLTAAARPFTLSWCFGGDGCFQVVLGCFDHIASCPGVMMPILQLARVCKERGVPVMLDGAHVLGQHRVNVGELEAAGVHLRCYQRCYLRAGHRPTAGLRLTDTNGGYRPTVTNGVGSD